MILSRKIVILCLGSFICFILSSCQKFSTPYFGAEPYKTPGPWIDYYYTNGSDSSSNEIKYNPILEGDRTIYRNGHGRIDIDAYGPGQSMDEYGRRVKTSKGYGAYY